MIKTLYSKKSVTFEGKISPCVMLLQPVQVAGKDGSVKRKSEFKSFDIAASLAPFKSSDFSVTNLQSVGALSKLKTTYMSHMSDMNVADSFENFSIEIPDSNG